MWHCQQGSKEVILYNPGVVHCRAFTPSHQKRKMISLLPEGCSCLWSIFFWDESLITCVTLETVGLGKEFCAYTWKYWSSFYEKCASKLLGLSLCSDSKVGVVWLIIDICIRVTCLGSSCSLWREIFTFRAWFIASWKYDFRHLTWSDDPEVPVSVTATSLAIGGYICRCPRWARWPLEGLMWETKTHSWKSLLKRKQKSHNLDVFVVSHSLWLSLRLSCSMRGITAVLCCCYLNFSLITDKAGKISTFMWGTTCS